MVQEMFVSAVVLAMVADRFVWRRKKAVICQIGKEVYTDDDYVVRFPVVFKTTVAHVKGAQVEYCLRDMNDPTTVITGKKRCLFFSSKGLTSEFLFFNRRYLKPGNWILQVRVTHGDSRINPLYRLFPHQSMLEKSFYFPAEKMKRGTHCG